MIAIAPVTSITSIATFSTIITVKLKREWVRKTRAANIGRTRLDTIQQHLLTENVDRQHSLRTALLARDLRPCHSSRLCRSPEALAVHLNRPHPVRHRY